MERYEGISRSPDSKRLATIGPSPAVQYSLRVSACRQRVHKYTPGNLFLAVAAAAPCSPVQCLVPISPLEMLSTVTPSSSIRTPTLRKNVQMICSQASRSSIAVAPSICIYEVQPPLECASSLAVIQVHSRGIPDGLPGPLPPLPLTLGLQSQKLNAFQVDTNSPAHTVRPPRLPPICMNKLTERITYLSRPIGTVRQPNNDLASPNWDCLTTKYPSIPTWGYNIWIEPLCAFFKYMRNPLVSWECPDGPSSGSPADPENAGYNYTSSPLHSEKPSSYAVVWAHIRNRSLAMGFRWLVWRNGIQLAQMARSPHNDPIWSSNQVLTVRLDNGNPESYLVATLEPSGLLYFPFGADTQSGIAAPLLHRWLVLSRSCWPPKAIAETPNHP